MKKEELQNLFISGKRLIRSVNTKKDYYTIGDVRITEKQFENLKLHFKGNWEGYIGFEGCVKHIYTYKNNK